MRSLVLPIPNYCNLLEQQTVKRDITFLNLLYYNVLDSTPPQRIFLMSSARIPRIRPIYNVLHIAIRVMMLKNQLTLSLAGALMAFILLRLYLAVFAL